MLDGGLTTSLPDGAEKHVLWGHQLLFDPDGIKILKTLHREFLDRGADVIGTMTYKLSEELLRELRARDMLSEFPAGNEQTVEELYLRAIRTAVQARDEFWADAALTGTTGRQKPLVFASCGPFTDATQCFKGATDPTTKGKGDEPEEDIRAYYSKKFQGIKNAQPDGVALETLPGSREAILACEELEKVKMDCWVCFCCQDAERSNNGEKLGDCVRAIERFSFVKAVGVNCFNPAHAEKLIKIVKANTSKPVCVYPNSGEVWDAQAGARCWHSGDKIKYLTGEDAVLFREAGASLIGGCCRVVPKQIQDFRAALCSSGNPR